MNTENRTFSSNESALEPNSSLIQDANNIQQAKRNSSLQSLMQINSEDPSLIAKFNKINPHALNILLFLIEHMKGFEAVICSQVLLMDFFGLSRSTVVKCIQDLKEHGLICIAKTGSSNVYFPNDNLIWKSHGTDDSKYCELSANIVLTYSEQDKPRYQNASDNLPDE